MEEVITELRDAISIIKCSQCRSLHGAPRDGKYTPSEHSAAMLGIAASIVQKAHKDMVTALES